jgi:hypothetical protein
MVTSVTKEVFITANGAEYTSESDAYEQEKVDMIMEALEGEDTSDLTVESLVHMICYYFDVTLLPRDTTTEETPDGPT